jgi:hypothetical protein
VGGHAARQSRRLTVGDHQGSVSPAARVSSVGRERNPIGGSTTTLSRLLLYYDAWQIKGGDFSDVPLADDFEFIGPVASFEEARKALSEHV